jgi:hypothetical protein
MARGLARLAGEGNLLLRRLPSGDGVGNSSHIWNIWYDNVAPLQGIPY